MQTTQLYRRPPRDRAFKFSSTNPVGVPSQRWRIWTDRIKCSKELPSSNSLEVQRFCHHNFFSSLNKKVHKFNSSNMFLSSSALKQKKVSKSDSVSLKQMRRKRSLKSQTHFHKHVCSRSHSLCLIHSSFRLNPSTILVTNLKIFPNAHHRLHRKFNKKTNWGQYNQIHLRATCLSLSSISTRKLKTHILTWKSKVTSKDLHAIQKSKSIVTTKPNGWQRPKWLPQLWKKRIPCRSTKRITNTSTQRRARRRRA